MSAHQTEKLISEFKETIKKINLLNEASGLLYWDMRTGAPKKSIPYRSEVVGYLATESFQLLISDRLGELLATLSEPATFDKLDALTQKMVSETKKEHERNVKIPPAQYREYVTLVSEAESIWELAKERDDFASFQPYLQKVVDFQRQFVDYWGYEKHPYDALLEAYEPGMTVEQLDVIFSELKDELVPFVQQIANASDQPNTSWMQQTFAIEKQRQFCEMILSDMGYDFEAGRVNESVHPFATGLNPGDVRITTAYKANDFTFSLFSSIHEGGHALYEQNIDASLYGTGLFDGASMGIHESQSRLWENMVGRSYEFWSRYYGHLQQMFPEAFSDVSLEDFYRGINVVQPSFIRIEADELTYNLHIMIRYELEKALFSDALSVSELPAAWNDMYEQYLGIRPENDREGVLQDVHWSGGAFGYFPSYALGNLYAAQFMEKMSEEMPFFQHIQNGAFSELTKWLKDRIYKHGKTVTPEELIVNVTGEPLNANALIRYFKTKFKEIYKI